jgi:hypothetical protein
MASWRTERSGLFKAAQLSLEPVFESGARW